MATLVETKELAETVIASVIAGVGITTIFSVAIWGGARFADLSRSGRAPAVRAGPVTPSVVAGVVNTTIFWVAVWGGARFAHLSRSGRPLAAGAAAALGG